MPFGTDFGNVNIHTGSEAQSLSSDLNAKAFTVGNDVYFNNGAFAPETRASMANDLEAGNRLELNWITGKVVALGRQHNVPTPGHAAVYAILKSYRMGRTK